MTTVWSITFLLLSFLFSVESIPYEFPGTVVGGFPASTFPLRELDAREQKEGRKIVRHRVKQKLSEDDDIKDDSKASRVTFENLRSFKPEFETPEPFEQENVITTTGEYDMEIHEFTDEPVTLESTLTHQTEEIYSDDDNDVTTESVEDNTVMNRLEKSLIGTFPFPDQHLASNRVGEHGHHGQGHHNHGHHEHDHPEVSSKDQFRYQDPSNEIEIIDTKKFELIHGLALEGGQEEVKDGRRCINKVMLVEETEYDEVLTCDHSYDNRCHTSYVTKYEPHQEEDCEEKFKKICYIDYEQKAYSETVQVCTTPWVKDCQMDDKEVEDQCQTVYQSECFTKQTIHQVEDDVAECKTVEEEKCEEVKEGYTTVTKCDKWPKEVCTLSKKKVNKYTPDTSCQKVPKELCAPKGCGITEGQVQCRDKVQTVVVDNPVEECDMEPIRTCKHVTKLVPRLVPSQECVDVPKEICARSKINPRRVQKPAIQKWCYTISEGEIITTPRPHCPDVPCGPGYICDDGDCKAIPGKVLLNSISVKTESCDECTKEGVKLTLLGERIGGSNGELPAPVPCTTEVLDNKDSRDFGKGQTTTWSGQGNGDGLGQQMGSCYEAPLNAMVRGGSITWVGEGDWKPASVCVDWKSTNMAYECKVVPKNPLPGRRGEPTQGSVTEWGLVDCRDLFPRQKCSDTTEVDDS